MTLRVAIHQIYYDEPSRQCLDPGFLPLDNAQSPDPGWFEGWPILQYLQSHTLEEDVWYGFLSPRFRHKSGCDSAQVFAFLSSLPPQTEVALFSPGWDQLCYFQNPWEQGQAWHPGLSEAMQAFLQHIGQSQPLSAIVTDVTTSVFSNYVVAKKRYWLAWQHLTEQMMAFANAHPSWGQQQVPYGRLENHQSIKAFLQERLASYVLATQPFRTAVCTRAHRQRIFERLFPSGEADRRLFALCDHFKRQYRKSANPAFLSAFMDTRKHIAFKHPY